METSDPKNFDWRLVMVFVLGALSNGALEFVGQMIVAGHPRLTPRV